MFICIAIFFHAGANSAEVDAGFALEFAPDL
jgi:hypothetical protein